MTDDNNGYIKPFWDDEYKHLKYKKMPFNNKYDVSNWREKGYTQDEKYFTGQMCNHNEKQPSWNETFVSWAKYQELDDCYRILVFLEDWKSGHYFEFNNEPIVNWKSGDYFVWGGKVPHMAANIGIEDRYTLQITGHK